MSMNMTLNVRKEKSYKDKTNTESAASSTSNQSSVTGNAGFSVSARLKNSLL